MRRKKEQFATEATDFSTELLLIPSNSKTNKPPDKLQVKLEIICMALIQFAAKVAPEH